MSKLREAAEKLASEQTHFKTAILDSFNGLDNRILEAQKRVDDELHEEVIT